MTYQEIVKHYPQHEEELNERAGILEYDAGFSRNSAESFAAAMIGEKYRLGRYVPNYELKF
jgi:hypothetical protein